MLSDRINRRLLIALGAFSAATTSATALHAQETTFAISAYQANGVRQSGFNSGNGYVFGRIADNCYSRGITFVANGGPSSGRSVFVLGVCSDAGVYRQALIKYSLSFNGLAQDYQGQGWGIFPLLFPYSVAYSQGFAVNGVVDSNGRALFFGTRIRRGTQPNPLQQILRITDRGFFDHRFGVEAIHTLGENFQISRGTVLPDGRAVVGRNDLAKRIVVFVRGESDKVLRTVDLPQEYEHRVVDIASDQQGRILVLTDRKVGESIHQRLYRFDPVTLELDSSFGQNGGVTIEFDGLVTTGQRLVSRDGRIAVLSTHIAQSQPGASMKYYAGVAVIDSNGKLDDRFSGDGKRLINFTNYTGELYQIEFRAITFGINGMLYLAGRQGQAQIALMALEADGSTVLNFGNGIPQDMGVVLDNRFAIPANRKLVSIDVADIVSDENGNLYLASSLQHGP